MRYYVTIGKGEDAYRREIAFVQTKDGLQAHIEGEGVEPRRVSIDLCALERGRGLSLLVGDESHDCYVVPSAGGFEVHYRGERQDVGVVDERELLAQSIHGSAARGPRQVRASMPGVVVSIDVSVDQTVDDGDTLLVVEAMKMQNPIPAEGGGTVTEIHVDVGQAVAAGDPLITLA